MRAWYFFITLLGLGISDRPAMAGDWTISGFAGVEMLGFSESPALSGQLEGLQLSMILAPELRWRSSDRSHQFKISAFGQWDAEDDQRTRFDVREAYYRRIGNDWEVLAGIGRVFWGVTESRHLVDVINQTDLIHDIDEEDKLGQPMLRLALDRDWGRLEVYSLLGFRERTFPGADGRVRLPLVVNTDEARYESEAENRRIDWAARFSQAIGDWDVGVHAFHGTDREPRLLLSKDQRKLIPAYHVVSQMGLDVQYTRGAWLWKLESLVREGQGKTFGATVAGIERTLYQFGSSAADLGLLVEVLWDGRDDTAPPTIYDNDTFLGVRLALNDMQNSSLLVGGLVDHDDGSVVLSLEGERRLGQWVSLEIEARFFMNVDAANDLRHFAEDDSIKMVASWGF